MEQRFGRREWLWKWDIGEGVGLRYYTKFEVQKLVKNDLEISIHDTVVWNQSKIRMTGRLRTG